MSNDNSTAPLNNNSNNNNDDKKINENAKPPRSSSRRCGLCCSITSAVLIPILSILIYFILSRLGVGAPSPPHSLFKNPQEPLLSPSDLEIAARLPLPPGNVAVDQDGRIFFNFHPEFNGDLHDILKENYTKIAIMGSDDVTFYPYPDLAFQAEVISVLSLRIDALHRLWLLDFADHAIQHSPKLFSIDLETDSLSMRYTFPADVAGTGSMLNDMQVDPSGKYIYIADTSIVARRPALVVFDIDRKISYRLCDSLPSFYGSSYQLQVEGLSIPNLGPLGMSIHIDSIALDRSGSYLYLGAVTSRGLLRLSTSHIVYMVERMASKLGEDPKALEGKYR